MGHLSLNITQHREKRQSPSHRQPLHPRMLNHTRTHRLTAALTSIRSINKTDAMTLSSNLGRSSLPFVVVCFSPVYLDSCLLSDACASQHGALPLW